MTKPEITFDEAAMLACMTAEELEYCLWLSKLEGDEHEAWLYSTELAARLVRSLQPMEPIKEWSE